MMTAATKARPKSKPAKRANIVETMATIFRPWFPLANDGTDTWAGWKSVLKAMDGLPMSDQEIAFFKSIAGDREPPTRRVSELVAVAARRTGKDSIASVIAAHSAVLFDQQDRLRPGEKAQIYCLACSRDQARIIFGYIKSYFDDIPQLKAMRIRETANTFELNNGVDITVATNSFRSVRGKPVFLAILDEAAFMASDDSANPDVEQPNIAYHCGVDPSGGVSDSFTAAISHADKDNNIILDALLEIKAPFDPDVAVEQISALIKSYRLNRCTGDRYSAQFVVSAFAKHGVTYEHSTRDRSKIYADVLACFTSGRARLLDTPKNRLVVQYAGLQRETTSMGRDKIDHARGQKDDLANAASLAMVLASAGTDWSRPGATWGEIFRRQIAARRLENGHPDEKPTPITREYAVGSVEHGKFLRGEIGPPPPHPRPAPSSAGGSDTSEQIRELFSATMKN